MLHGIELAKPDEYWVAQTNVNGRFLGYVAAAGEQVRIPNEPELDCFYSADRHSSLVFDVPEGLTKGCPVHRIYFGPTGTVMADGASRDAALREIMDSVTKEQVALFERRIIGWLETHPLSPRYRWAGTQEQDSA